MVDNGKFEYFGETYDISESIPAITLTLSKTITEILPPPITVSFVPVTASYPAKTIYFSPNAALPDGVTYILTDDSTPPNSWNTAQGFDGEVNVSTYSTAGLITFTQTFYLNNVEITSAGSQRTVKVQFSALGGGNFVSTYFSDTGSVTLQLPE
ncbi:hypothetical protein R84B8_01442 [Treponema sp. R8-4-B8]